MSLSEKKEEIFSHFKNQLAKYLKDDFDVDFSNAIKEEVKRTAAKILTANFISLMADEYNLLHSDYESIKKENSYLKTRIKELEDINDTKRQIIHFLDSDTKMMSHGLFSKIESLEEKISQLNKNQSQKSLKTKP